MSVNILKGHLKIIVKDKKYKYRHLFGINIPTFSKGQNL